MGCEITSGYNKVCDSPGGVDTFYAFAVKDSSGVSNYVPNTLEVEDGAVTAIELKTGKYAFPFNIEIETASFTDTKAGERTNGAYARTQAGTVMLHGNTASMITDVEAMAKGRHAIIAKLNDDTYELFFMENGAVVSDERATGTAYEDMNGTTLTFAGKEKTKACKISSTLVFSLLAP
jgi:hypothetical protein